MLLNKILENCVVSAIVMSNLRKFPMIQKYITVKINIAIYLDPNADQFGEFVGMSANPADKSSRVASRNHYRIRAASISKYSDNLGMGGTTS